MRECVEMSGKDWIDLILNTGGVFGLAIFSIWILNKVWQLRLEDMQRYAEDMRELRDATFRALENNTRVMQQLVEELRKEK